MLITIDGASGTGKSTVAKALAKKLAVAYFDTGAMYRSFAIWNEKAKESKESYSLETALDSFPFEIRREKNLCRYFLGEVEVTEDIRSSEVANKASLLAKEPKVRHALVEAQRKFAQSHNAVFEGRDMGTVVFPEAKYKFFLTADATMRAKRRYAELLVRFPDKKSTLDLTTVEKEILERDHQDASRKMSPLCAADDAIVVDTSSMTIEEVVEALLKRIEEVG